MGKKLAEWGKFANFVSRNILLATKAYEVGGGTNFT